MSVKTQSEAWVEADLVITGAGELLTCAGGGAGLGAGSVPQMIPGGAVAARAGRVVWVGESSRLGDEVRLLPGVQQVAAEGRVVMPGLVECHTHLVFAADRADEFQMRVAGATYQEVAAAGGGIMSTVRATRAASDEALRSLARRRLDRFLTFGVTTVEAKSGYGLSLEHELRLLEVCRDAGAGHAIDVVPTLLGAHAVPVEFSDRAEAYVDMVVKKMIPAAAKRGLARFCDAFCEEGAFTLVQCRRVLEAGIAHGLAPKLHADQLSSGGGTEMAVELGAVSVDHLDHVSEAGIAALAAAPSETSGAAGPRGAPAGRPCSTVAVLLPGATFFLGEGGQAPARRLLDAGVRVALSTDFNPGSSPTQNLWLMASMGCSQLRMSADEVIRAITIEAAAALGLDHEVGSLEVGKKADILILENPRRAEIPYRYGMNPVWRVYKEGKCVVKRDQLLEV
jgi:imidazolonepropionase